MLEGITVLDLSQRFPGGYASLWLADLGAEVIRIEPVDASNDYRFRHPMVNGIGSSYAATGRNKKSIGLNLKDERGKEIFMKLAAKSDVIIEGFSPGVVSRLDIDYNAVRAVNESIVYCSMSGYGQEGLMRDKPGYDLNYQAISGMLSLGTSQNEKPNLSGLSIADIGAGLVSALTIVSSLFQQIRTKKGAYIDLAIADVPFHLMSPYLMNYFAKDTTSSFTDGTYCCYNVYQCKCGKWIALAAIETKFWNNFCNAVGRPEWIDHQFEYAKLDNKVFNEITELFKQKTQSEWIYLLESKNTCISPVVSADEVWNSKWTNERSLTFSISDENKPDLPQVSLPFSLDKTIGKSSSITGGTWEAVNNPKYPPDHGEDTMDLLNSLGFSEKEIQSLSSENIIKLG